MRGQTIEWMEKNFNKLRHATTIKNIENIKYGIKKPNFCTLQNLEKTIIELFFSYV
jgi:hypothetical protein